MTKRNLTKKKMQSQAVQFLLNIKNLLQIIESLGLMSFSHEENSSENFVKLSLQIGEKSLKKYRQLFDSQVSLTPTGLAAKTLKPLSLTLRC